MTFDPLNRLSEVSDHLGMVGRFADAGSRRVLRTLQNGVDDVWSWDEYGRLGGIRSIKEGQVLRSLSHERSRSGFKSSIRDELLESRRELSLDADNRLTAEDLYNGLDPAEMIPPTVSRTYEWNDAMSLLRATRLDQSGTTTAISSESRRLHDDRNRTTSLDGKAIGWDANGNLVDLPALSAGTRTVPLGLTYDASNRLVGASSPEGSTEVIYDAFGRKVRRTVEAETVTRTIDYVLDGNSVLEEIENGSMASRYVLGRSPDEILRIEEAPRLGEPLESRLYPLQNELGNVEYVTDESGLILQRIEYEGFGEFRLFRPDESGGWQSESTPRTHYLFQGREWLPELGAYDFRARTLWPQLAGFGQEDPSGFADHANLYQAFMANPYEYTDPTGRVVVLMHGIKDDAGGWAGVVGKSLGLEWQRSKADPGQDVINLVNKRGGSFLYEYRNHWLMGLVDLCPNDEFCLANAYLSGTDLGTLDRPTRRAGEQAANYFAILRGKLDASFTRVGEPVQVLAHSHGTSMLLAAAESKSGKLDLGNVVMAGSDINRFRDISALIEGSQMLYSFWSPGDHVTRHAVQAGGGHGFQYKKWVYSKRINNEKLVTRLLDIPGDFRQIKFREVEHTGDVREMCGGRIPWMSQVLATRAYAGLLKITAPRAGGESEAWIREYERIRNAMGLQKVVPLPGDYREPYYGPKQ